MWQKQFIFTLPEFCRVGGYICGRIKTQKICHLFIYTCIRIIR